MQNRMREEMLEMVLSALIALEGDERPGDVSGAQCQSID